MGLFGRFGKKKTEEPKKAAVQKDGQPMVMGFALLKDTYFDAEKLFHMLQKEFQGEGTVEVKPDRLLTIVAHIGDTTLRCTHMPRPVPDGEIQRQIGQNMLHEKTARALENHKSFLIISTANQDMACRMQECVLFSRFCAMAMKLDNAAGMYIGGSKLLIAPELYVKQVELMKLGAEEETPYFPTELWIRIGYAINQGKKQAFTDGMNDFGFYDLRVYHTNKDPKTLYQWLHWMSMQELLGEAVYQDGDTVDFGGGKVGTIRQRENVLQIVGV